MLSRHVGKLTVNIGILGLGTVGVGVVNTLHNNQAEIKRRSGTQINIIQAAVKDINKKRLCVTDNIKISNNAFEVVNNNNIDVILELIGGVNLAKELVIKAIKNGKHVITANKSLIANYGNELLALAKKNNVYILFEAAVAGGIPIIKLLKQGLSANKIELIIGIINGTSNFILTNMSNNGKSFETSLKEAQDLGYAEADPALDINGIDAAHKLTILSSIAFGQKLQFDKISTQGINQIKKKDIIFANKLGFSIKHLSIAKNENNKIQMYVRPTLITKKHLLSNVDGVMNAILVKANAVGDTIYYGAGAGGQATASSVIADLIDIIKNTANKDILGWQQFRTFTYCDNNDIESVFYLHLLVDDKPGVLANIATTLTKYNISIEKVIQNQITNNNNADIAIITNKIKTIKIKNAVANIQKNSFIKEDIKIIHVETLN